MTDLYDPGPTLLSKYWQFMRLCVRARACVCAHVHFKVISVMIGDDCHCKQGVGALELVVGLMVVGYGGVLVKGEKLSLSISLLWWGTVLVFFFGMISGFGSFLSKFCILSYFCVQLIRRLAFQKC